MRQDADPCIGKRIPCRTLAICLQDKPYALFGTCLGAITAYEIARRASKAGHPPVALFTAAVSPPHIYAEAVMKLYVTRQLAEGEAINLTEIMATLQSWDKIPKETLMMVRSRLRQIPSDFSPWKEPSSLEPTVYTV